MCSKVRLHTVLRLSVRTPHQATEGHSSGGPLITGMRWRLRTHTCCHANAAHLSDVSSNRTNWATTAPAAWQRAPLDWSTPQFSTPHPPHCSTTNTQTKENTLCGPASSRLHWLSDKMITGLLSANNETHFLSPGELIGFRDWRLQPGI